MRISPPVGGVDPHDSFGQAEICIDQFNICKDLPVSGYGEAFFRPLVYYPAAQPVFILTRGNQSLGGRGQGSKGGFTPLGAFPSVVMAERAG